MAEQYDVSTVTIKNWIHKGEELYAKQNPNPNRTPDKKNENFYIKIYQEHKHRPLRKQIVNDFMSCHQTAHTNCHQIA